MEEFFANARAPFFISFESYSRAKLDSVFCFRIGCVDSEILYWIGYY